MTGRENRDISAAMRMGLSGQGGRHWAAIALAIVALALKVVFPSGYMLDRAGDGRPELVICTGHGPLQLDHRQDRHGPARSKSDAPCSFAGNVTPVLTAWLDPEPAVQTFGPLAQSPSHDQARRHTPAAPPPPSTGPPARPLTV